MPGLESCASLTRVEAIPCIDLGRSRRDGATSPSPEVVEQIADACRRIGFFQIIGHGIADAQFVRLREEMCRFFLRPRNAKRTVLRGEVNPWGYYDAELTKNTPDWKEIFDFGRLPRPDLLDDDPRNRGVDGQNRWPADLPGFREAMLDHLRACEAVAFTLLEAMAIGLGVEPHRLNPYFVPSHSSFVRLNYYPRCDDPAPPDAPDLPTRGRLGVNQHADAGALTLVTQTDVGGLQVRTGNGWIDVEPIPRALVVNVGDMMQVWSNDRYRSPIHRVVVSDRSERFSAPFFFNPSYEADCAPLPELVARDGASVYRPVPWAEFRRLRAAGDYADVGEEIQVDHYRIVSGV